MEDVNAILRCLMAAAGVAVLFYKHREVSEAIEALRNNFPRGGPPTPTHPSPVADAAFLRRKRGTFKRTDY